MSCGPAGIHCIFLHGNHDSYLSEPAVVNAAREWQTKLFQSGYKATTVYDRVKEHLEDRIFFEYGQRVDTSNCDGNTFGHTMTNLASGSLTVLKSFDSVRRESFVTGAAVMHLKEDLGLYVMGHTHMPALKLVEISHWRGDLFRDYLVPIYLGAVNIDFQKSRTTVPKNSLARPRPVEWHSDIPSKVGLTAAGLRNRLVPRLVPLVLSHLHYMCKH